MKMRTNTFGKRIVLKIAAIVLLVLFFQGAQARRFRDTVRFKRTIVEQKQITLSDSALNEIGIDSLLNKVENVHNTLDRINNATTTGFDTREIEGNLPEIDSNIDIIDENLTLYSSVLDVKNLQMFDVLLTSLQGQLEDWRNNVNKLNRDLVEMSNEMTGFRKDTVLRSLLADTVFRSLYMEEIKDLRNKWGLAKKAIAFNQGNLSHLQARVSNEYFTTIDLQNKIRDLLKKTSAKSLGKEYDFLWSINKNSESESERAGELARRSYMGQQKILRFYFIRNVDNQLWMLVVGLLFGLWIFRNFNKLEKDKNSGVVHLRVFYYIKKVPFLATLVVLFNIAPFFDIHPPTAYVEIGEFLLVLTLTFMLWRNWPRPLYYYWLVIACLYIIFSVTGTLLTPDFKFRMFLFILNFLSLVFGIFWLRAINKYTVPYSLMIKVVSIIYIVLNLSAAGCNLAGRLSLAKIFSVTSVYGLTQIIGLTIFIQIVLEAFQLQTTVNHYKGGLAAKLNFHKIQKLLSRLLIIISIFVWSIVFSISLNIYNLLFSVIYGFLTIPRKIGSTTFELGNILLFLFIIYVSNLLQQGVGSLYGKDQEQWDPELKKNGSRLAMTRLVLIVLGFMIAVAASGLPIDKITIVLGALGVGIGLGLQTIVNNLVSGVILIFEQPFRIGDFIELGDIKGRVLDIGIRSSRVVREEGAEVIVPNGDLLSGRVVNWTLRDDNIRIDLSINIEAGHPFDEVKKIIEEGIEQSHGVIKTIPVEIFMSGINDKTMGLNLLVWITDVHKLKETRSDLLKNIHRCLTDKKINIV